MKEFDRMFIENHNLIQVSAGIVKIPPERGGAVESHIVNISKHLSKENKVTIIDRKYDDSDVREINGVKIHRIPSRSISLALMSGRLNPIINECLFSKRLRKYEIFEDADVIHAHNVYTANAAVKIANRYKIPFVYTCHNGMWCTEDVNFYERRIVRPTEKRIIKKSDISIAVSENLKKNICEKAGIPDEKIVAIYNGVDTEKFNPDVPAGDIKEKYGLKDSKIVLFVGRVAPAKGLEYLVKAANIIINEKNVKDMKFLIVGPFKYMFSEGKARSDYAEKLMDLVRKYSLQNNFIFTDAVPEDDLPMFYAACDVFVLPSVFEAFPMVLLEAMASGKPVIGSDVGGISEVIKDGENGFVFEPKNYEDLAKKILELIEDDKLREEMGGISRKIAEKDFSWEKIAKDILQVYRGALVSEFEKDYYKHKEEYFKVIEDEEELDLQNSPHKIIFDYITPDTKVLDIACGTGKKAEFIGVNKSNYYGVDISLIALKVLKDNRRGFPILSDAEKIPFKSGIFDVVLCMYSLEHFSDPKAVLKEMVRVTKRGGKIIIFGPAWDSPTAKLIQLSHKSKLFKFKIHLRLLLKIIANELKFSYKSLIIKDVAAFHNSNIVADDTDAIHVTLVQETVMFLQNYGKVLHISNFRDWGRDKGVKRLVRYLMPIVSRTPVFRWFISCFPIVVVKTEEVLK